MLSALPHAGLARTPSAVGAHPNKSTSVSIQQTERRTQCNRLSVDTSIWIHAEGEDKRCSTNKGSAGVAAPTEPNHQRQLIKRVQDLQKSRRHLVEDSSHLLVVVGFKDHRQDILYHLTVVRAQHLLVMAQSMLQPRQRVVVLDQHSLFLLILQQPEVILT